MASIMKTFAFDAAHDLPGHNGKCANYHGHTYHVEVIIEGDIKKPSSNQMGVASDDGMVVDYYEIDQTMKPLLAVNADRTGYLDHQYLNETLTDCPRTTAELIACWIYGTLRRSSPIFKRYDNLDVRVKVSETPNTYAQVDEADWRKNGQLGVDINVEPIPRVQLKRRPEAMVP